MLQAIERWLNFGWPWALGRLSRHSVRMAPFPLLPEMGWRNGAIQPPASVASRSDSQIDIGDVDDELPACCKSPLSESTSETILEARDLLCQGNLAYRSCNFEEAISHYSKALHSQSPDQALLLSNRSASFCSLSKMLRKMPAAVSEEKALYGLDPMSLVQLALKDAERLLKICTQWPKAYFRKGSALVMLEQYEEAREVFLSGLQIDPSSLDLQSGMRDVAAEDLPNEKRKRAKVQRSDEFDCILCLKLMYNPITTPCGHSFCRACLLQAMDHGNKCPMCRTVLFVTSKTYPLSFTLNNIIQRNFPDEYAERKAEMDAITLAGEEILPLFVMDVVLPCEKLQLNIFEPRYRLMVRRIMEGNHRMGMVGIDHETGTLAEVACEVEICECEPMHDGRFYLEVEGKRRCRITRTWEQDGYRVGQVQWLQDVVPAEGSQEKKQIQELAITAAEVARSWMTRAQELVRSDRRRNLTDLMSQAEGMPNTSDAERFSFWVANLLHLRPHDKLKFLRMTNTQERLTQEMNLLHAGHSQGCHIQ